MHAPDDGDVTSHPTEDCGKKATVRTRLHRHTVHLHDAHGAPVRCMRGKQERRVFSVSAASVAVVSEYAGVPCPYTPRHGTVSFQRPPARHPHTVQPSPLTSSAERVCICCVGASRGNGVRKRPKGVADGAYGRAVLRGHGSCRAVNLPKCKRDITALAHRNRRVDCCVPIPNVPGFIRDLRGATRVRGRRTGRKGQLPSTPAATAVNCGQHPVRPLNFPPCFPPSL